MGQCTSWTHWWVSKDQGHGTQQPRRKKLSTSNIHRGKGGRLRQTDRSRLLKGVVGGWEESSRDREPIRGVESFSRDRLRKGVHMYSSNPARRRVLYVISQKSVRIDCTRLHTEHIRGDDDDDDDDEDDGSSENRCSSLAGLCSTLWENWISASHGNRSCWDLFFFFLSFSSVGVVFDTIRSYVCTCFVYSR